MSDNIGYTLVCVYLRLVIALEIMLAVFVIFLLAVGTVALIKRKRRKRR